MQRRQVKSPVQRSSKRKEWLHGRDGGSTGSVQNRAELFDGIYDVNAGWTNAMPLPPHSGQSYDQMISDVFFVPHFVASCLEEVIVKTCPDCTAKLRDHNVTHQRVVGDTSSRSWTKARVTESGTEAI